MRRYYVYIVASKSRRIYTGVTNSLEHRVWQHRNGFSKFTTKYNIHRLVFVSEFATAIEAIRAEKYVKGLNRAKRVALIESMNPAWDDLAEGWDEGGKAETAGNGG